MQKEFPARPITGASVVVWKGDQLLLIRRRNEPGAGLWALPGGTQELGESLAETARREVLEETGTVCTVGTSLFVYDVIERQDTAVRFHFVIVGLDADWVSGEPVPGDDAADARWAGVAEALDLITWPESHELIRRAVRRRDR
jgi:ADP-ribose pyrophosphatase YjhB (NUDIX family)